MAKCTKGVTWPDKIVSQPPAIIEVVLRLTEDEAIILHSVLDRIGGNPAGPRGSIDAINIAFDKAKIKPGNYKLEIYNGPFTGPYLRIEKENE